MATSYSIGKHFESFIQGLLETGRYSTASEVMREGLRMVEEREERRKAKLEALRAEIQKGFDSGPMEEIWRYVRSNKVGRTKAAGCQEWQIDRAKARKPRSISMQSGSLLPTIT